MECIFRHYGDKNEIHREYEPVPEDESLSRMLVPRPQRLSLQGCRQNEKEVPSLVQFYSYDLSLPSGLPTILDHSGGGR